MPPAVTSAQLSNIAANLTPVITLFNQLDESFGPPFLCTISSTTQSLIDILQNVKRNKNDCLHLVESIQGILYAIGYLHTKSETPGTLPPGTLFHIGKFTETLCKINSFVEVQRDGNKIKHFFRQSEMNTLLKQCHTGLEQAVEAFKMMLGDAMFTSLTEMEIRTETMHNELLELISTLSDRSSSVMTTASFSSSDSLSMLQPKPQIFHGRESELENIVTNLTKEAARIAILGAGGMGKTSLARTALHHPDIAAKYESRFFVPCESAATCAELAAQIASHVGLKPGNSPKNLVVQYFSRRPPCLLILDNLETPWEPLQARGEVEEFLSLLTDVQHLALIVTMRGAERPAKVRWTRPFLLPLRPLSNDAARKTFFDIADDFHPPAEIDQLLLLTDNMPLAVNLMAHLVEYEGCSNVLTRWKTEKSSLLSDGYDRQSSLDISIKISLSSPRVNSGDKELLSLLSILPDGLSDVELVQTNLPICNIMRCKAALLSTSLAYSDESMRLKVLVPIREYIHDVYPPGKALVHILFKYFRALLDLYWNYYDFERATVIPKIISNIGNLHNILLQGLYPDNPLLTDVITCAIHLSSFSEINGHGRLSLMDRVAAVFPQPCNHKLEAEFLTELIHSSVQFPNSQPEQLIGEAIAHFRNFNDPDLECRFYIAIGNCYFNSANLSATLQNFNKALALAQSYGLTNQESIALTHIARIESYTGDSLAGQAHAHEAQRLAKLSVNFFQEGQALWIEALCFTDLGNYKYSMLLLNKARELLQLCGMSKGSMSSNVMTSTAEVHRLKSEYMEARRINSQIVQNISAEDEPSGYAFTSLNIAEIDVIIGATRREVQQNLEKAKVCFDRIGHLAGIICWKTIVADLDLREGDTKSASALFQECVKSSWGIESQVVSHCLEKLADISWWTVLDFDRTWSIVYLVYSVKLNHRLSLCMALCFLGDVCLFDRDEDTAHSLLTVALEGFTNMDVHRSRDRCMLRLGDLAQKWGDLPKAIELWKDAQPLFERSSQVKDVAEIQARLRDLEKD